MCTGPRILRPPIVSSTTWAFSLPWSNSARSFLRATCSRLARRVDASSFASRGLIRMALSHADLRDRIRALLQPAVVGEAAVVHLVVGDEADLEVVLGERPPAWGFLATAASRRTAHRGSKAPSSGPAVGRALEQAVVQEFLKRLLASRPCVAVMVSKTSVGSGRFPRRRPRASTSTSGQAVEERQDHRLDRHDRAVDRAGIAPGLEIMRRRDMGPRRAEVSSA
jgi:hypothetical protein